MADIHAVRPRPIDPDLLGPLGGPAPSIEAGTLFKGDKYWFGEGEIHRREGIWKALASRVEALCSPDERVIFFARAHRRLTFGMYLGLGWRASHYHLVTLVVTDHRLIELPNDFHGEPLEAGTRSFPWTAAVEVRARMSALTLVGRNGKKFRWRLRTRGDRRVMALLAPRIAERLLRAGGEQPASYPVEHCPRCHAAKPQADEACPACGALVRSARLATLLSLAFPGAGLAYVGHPLLAFFDFVGEVVIFAGIAVVLAAAGTGDEVVGVALLGAFLLVLTKLESIHVSRLLAARHRPEDLDRRARFQRIVPIGSALSVIALVGAAAMTGRLVDVVDRDLDFAAAAEGGWSGSRGRGAWATFADDPTMRSQWTHEDGFIVSVFAYPGTTLAELDSFVRSYLEQEEAGGAVIVLSKAELPGGFLGHRVIEHIVDEQGTPLALVTYFVLDGEGGDIHQVYALIEREAPSEDEGAASGTEAGSYADGMTWALLERGRWIAAVAPTD